MTLSLNLSQNFLISSSYDVPEWLRQKLEQAWRQRYAELYEEIDTTALSLEETVSNLLDALDDGNTNRCHLRYVYMAFILALAVEPTIKAYSPTDTRPEKVFEWVEKWLKTQRTLCTTEGTLASKCPQQFPSSDMIHEMFPKLSEGTQAFDEALDVFKNVLQVLDPSLAKAALLEIIDDCLEGYAIFPGSQGRRDLFNWWLSEVVTAAWCLQFPETVYTIKGIKPLHQYMNQTPFDKY